MDQNQLNLIALHLRKGVYDEVAQLLTDIHQQISPQLPQPKVNRMIETARREELAKAKLKSV